MRIDPSKSQPISKHTVGRTEKAGIDGAAGKTERVSGKLNCDQVALSQQAKDLQLARKALAEVPAVRQEKVQELKARIASGEYDIDTQEVARKLISGE